MSKIEAGKERKNRRCSNWGPEDKELGAWYVYDFGIGPIALAIVVFAPLLIVTQAKYEASKNGIEWRHVRSDGDLCPWNVTATGSDQDYARPSGMDEDCQWFPLDTKVPGLGLDYTAVAAYISMLVLFFSAVLLILLGPIGDVGSHRRKALAFCVAVWCVAFVAPIAIQSSELYLANALLVFVGATAWNFGNRALRNAYLPLLVRSSPLLLAKTKELNEEEEEEEATATAAASAEEGDGEATTNANNAKERYHSSRTSGSFEEANPKDTPTPKRRLVLNKVSEQLATEYSIVTSAYFFVGQMLGFVVQGVIVILLAPKETEPYNTFNLRLCCVFAAVFGLIFCTKSIYGLGERPGPPFVGGKLKLLTVGAGRVLMTLKLMRSDLRQMMVFLIGRTLHWTAVQSILTNATLFIEREFSLTADELVIPLVVMLVTSMFSALALGAFVKKYENSILKVTLVVCCLTNFIPFYMLLGLRERWEIYVLFVLAGMLVSPFPALSRGILAQMIPIGFSSTIMSLEGILELGTSWIGPLVIGLIVDLTGSIRWGVLSMTAIMLPALPFLLWTNLGAAAEEKADVESNHAKSKSSIGISQSQRDADLEMEPMFNLAAPASS